MIGSLLDTFPTLFGNFSSTPFNNYSYILLLLFVIYIWTTQTGSLYLIQILPSSIAQVKDFTNPAPMLVQSFCHSETIYSIDFVEILLDKNHIPTKEREKKGEEGLELDLDTLPLKLIATGACDRTMKLWETYPDGLR